MSGAPQRSFITTHVLDSAIGSPAADVAVVLERRESDGWAKIAVGTTNENGRIDALGPTRLASGTYRLTFAVGEYYATQGTATFYPEVSVTCQIDGEQPHYHVPLLLSPFAYSTYRGS